MRRRASEELMEAQLFEEFGVAGNRPPPPPEHAHSPQTRVALQSLYASMDDNANRSAPPALLSYIPMWRVGLTIFSL